MLLVFIFFIVFTFIFGNYIIKNYFSKNCYFKSYTICFKLNLSVLEFEIIDENNFKTILLNIFTVYANLVAFLGIFDYIFYKAVSVIDVTENICR